MKVLQISLVSLTVGSSAAASLRGDTQRDLAVLYYPKRVGDSSQHYCTANLAGSYEVGYATELACCKAYFPNQESGKCLSMLPAPPTVSPTGADGPDAWYADYDLDFSVGVCINTLPTPNGRNVYDTQLECCKGEYATQTSGACVADLPSPPTVSPTPDGGVDIWYKNPDVGDWTVGYCINTLPTPNGAVTYDTELDCCKGEYAGQSTGKCLSMLPAPPTVSPTPDGGVDAWYANRDVDWTLGVCINTLPAPSGSRIYDTELECCKGEYAGQSSGACIASLPAPPTVSPTPDGGVDAWYPDFDLDWADGVCINTLPAPGGRTIYASQLECCKGAYPGQASGACVADLPAPPTVSPTGVDGPDAWYADRDLDWALGECINVAPVPNGRKVYDTELECCKGEYAGQTSGACLAGLPAPPTVSPTPDGGVDIWYKAPDVDWTLGYCINTLPTPNGATTYTSQLECCKGAYAGQASGACLADLPAPPTVSPTPDGGVDAWYADFDLDWADGVCINTLPAPSGRKIYDSQLECCKSAYPGQSSGACIASLPAPPTVSPTPDGGPNAWYADRDLDWTLGECINVAPVPNGARTYDSELECCKGEYAGQSSGACLASLPAAPTASPVGSDAEFFPIWSGWETGHCDNDPTKVTSGNNYRYATQAECCEAWFTNQQSGACLAFDPTYGSRSPTQSPVL